MRRNYFAHRKPPTAAASVAAPQKKKTAAASPATLELTEEYKRTVRQSSYIGSKGWTVPRSVLLPEDERDVRRKLTVVKEMTGPTAAAMRARAVAAVDTVALSDDAPDHPNLVRAFRVNPKKIYLPRFWAEERYGGPAEGKPPAAGDNTSIQLSFQGTLRPQQQGIVSTYVNHVQASNMRGLGGGGGGGLLSVPCAAGKCLAPNTPVLMFDGRVKRACEVEVGDFLMGDDGRSPRRVLSLARGTEEMFRIVEEYGDYQDSYVVNRSHILTVKLGQCRFYHSPDQQPLSVTAYGSSSEDLSSVSNEGDDAAPMTRGRSLEVRRQSMEKRDKDAFDLSLEDYLKLPSREREDLVGYRVSVDFGRFSKKLMSDIEIEHKPYTSGQRAGSGEDGDDEKDAIPPALKTGSRRARFLFLGGFIDGCLFSHYDEDSACIRLYTRTAPMQDDLVFLARSLGFAAYRFRPRDAAASSEKGSATGGNTSTEQGNAIDSFHRKQMRRENGGLQSLRRNTGTNTLLQVVALHRPYGVAVYGRGIHTIPSKTMADRIADHVRGARPPWWMDYDVRAYSFRVIRETTLDDAGNETSVGTYCGFTLDGNGRFLLGDFSVTHNTVMAINLICRLGQRALVVVHKEFLLNQWIERITEFARRPDGSPPSIGRIQGDTFDVEGRDVVLGMLQTLYSRPFSDSAFAPFGMLIVDETHRICSEQFSQAFFRFTMPYTLGISATMARKDGMDCLLSMFLGPLLHHEERKGDDAVQVRAIEFVSPGDQEYNAVINNPDGTVKYTSMISKICEYEPRRQFLLRVVADLRAESPEKQIMVLSFTKDILHFLHRSISDRGGELGTVGYYVGGMKQAALTATESKNIVLATYSMAQEALDIKTLSTLVMVTPKTDVVQSVGRILRMKHKSPVVVDIVDTHQVFKNQWSKRRQYYKSCGYDIWQTSSDRYTGMLDVHETWKLVFSGSGGGSSCAAAMDAKEDDDGEEEEDLGPARKRVCLLDV